MRSKTLYYCPIDDNELIFEEVYDERVDFAYQPLHEPPRICPRCGSVLFKKDCALIMELYPCDSQIRPAGG